MTNSININPTTKQDEVFIDTNILVFLFSPSFIPTKEWQYSKYSPILTELIENKNKLYINSHVVSEFINSCLRRDFNENFNQDGSKDYKKDYRNSPEYDETLRLTLNQLKKILKKTIQIDDNFSSFEILEEYKKNTNMDFNDLIIAKSTVLNNLKLLTDDKDMSKYPNIKLVTV